MNPNANQSFKFAIHKIGDVTIYQANGECILSGVRIPHGYVNATHLLKAASEETGRRKTWANYLKNENTQEFLEALAEANNTAIEYSADASIDASALYQGFEPTKHPLVIVLKGGNKQNEQGTFCHIDVALNLAQWASPKFAVKVAKVLRAVIAGDFKALTPEAARAQAEVQKVWDELRSYTKETFWFVTDSIKNYYIANPRVEKYDGQNYAEYFDALNVGLFGKTAKQIAQELGIKRGQLNRDHFGKHSLKRIEMIQRISESQIKTGMNPLQACQMALKVMNYSSLDYRE